MEAMVFAIPASRALVEKTHEVVFRAPDTALDQMREVVKETGYLYVDDVIDGLILSLLRQGNTMSRMTTSMLENLAGIIKTVCHGIIGQAAASAGQEDLEAITDFFRERVVTTAMQGERRGLLAYPLEEPDRDLLLRAIRAGLEGRAESERETYLKAMHGVVDHAIYHHFETPFGMLKLGYFTRKAVDLGRRAIHSAGSSAVKKSIAHDSEEQLVQLSKFLQDCVLPVSRCRPA